MRTELQESESVGLLEEKYTLSCTGAPETCFVNFDDQATKHVARIILRAAPANTRIDLFRENSHLASSGIDYNNDVFWFAHSYQTFSRGRYSVDITCNPGQTTDKVQSAEVDVEVQFSQLSDIPVPLGKKVGQPGVLACRVGTPCLRCGVATHQATSSNSPNSQEGGSGRYPARTQEPQDRQVSTSTPEACSDAKLAESQVTPPNAPSSQNTNSNDPANPEDNTQNVSSGVAAVQYTCEALEHNSTLYPSDITFSDQCLPPRWIPVR